MAEEKPTPKQAPTPKVDPEALKIITLTPEQGATSQMVNLSKDAKQ